MKSSFLSRSIRVTAIALACATLTAILNTIPYSVACPCAELKVPAGLSESEYSGKIGLAFAKTPAYKKEFDDAIASAKSVISKHNGEKYLAIVSDIDETILDNRPFFEQHDEFKWDDFFVWVEQAQAPSLKKSTDLLARARQDGIAIFLITGRMEKLRKGTIRNLVRNNIAYDGLYMRPDGDKSSASEFKSGVRKQIEDMGFTVVVNIGDQFSDLEGGYAKECAKLPNKMYFIK